MELTIRIKLIALVLISLYTASCQSTFREDTDVQVVSSPDKKLKLIFSLPEGVPTYELLYEGKPVLEQSRLGYTFREMPSMIDGFELEKVGTGSFDETWETVWGESRLVRNHYNELTLSLVESADGGRKLNMVFRVFNDGIGFRYQIPEQEGVDQIEVMAEETEFNFPEDHLVWYQPCDTTVSSWEDGYNSYERLHQNRTISEVATLMHTPATLQTKDGLYLSIHEANLTDYSSMVLAKGRGLYDMKCDLVPWPDGVKVKAKGSLTSPWRTIIVGTRPGDLMESNLILNLNEPNKLADVSWIKPMKYMGIWWEMHLNKSTWEAGPRHGANTANAVRYIDFASINNVKGVLVEGWNTGWEVWTTAPDFDFVTPYDDYDLDYLAEYATEKGVGLIAHHETSGDVERYEKEMPRAFQLLEDKGIHALKTGYVGWIKPDGQNHHGQWMVNHYRRVVELAAKHKVCIVAHEPIKPTGISRTYPNMLSREAVRGMEYNAWSTGNPPDHTTILPFTMLTAGPLDYTPGIFQADLSAFREGNSIHSTVANQLALYVVIYSPVQMAADLPEHYEGKKEFKFIRDVAVDWEESRVIDGKIGDYVTIARKVRGGKDWYMGAITDENAREVAVKLDFLTEAKSYVAEIYADAEDASFDLNPMAVDISERLVDQETLMTLKLAPGGGQAIRFRVANSEDMKRLAGKAG